MSSRSEALEQEAFRRLDQVIAGARAAERARGLPPSDSPENESLSGLNLIEMYRGSWEYIRSGSANHAFQSGDQVLLVTRSGVDRNYDSYLTPVLAHHLTEITNGMFVPVRCCTAEWTIQHRAEGDNVQDRFPEGNPIPPPITDQIIAFAGALDAAPVSRHVERLLRERRPKNAPLPNAHEVARSERDGLVDAFVDRQELINPMLVYLGIDLNHMAESLVWADVLKEGPFPYTKLAPIHQRDLHAGNMNVRRLPKAPQSLALSIYDVNAAGPSIFPREIAYWLSRRPHTPEDERRTIEQAVEVGTQLGYPDMPKVLDHFVKLVAGRNVEAELVELHRHRHDPAALHELLHGQPTLGLHFANRHLASSSERVGIEELRERLIDGMRRNWGVRFGSATPADSPRRSAAAGFPTDTRTIARGGRLGSRSPRT